MSMYPISSTILTSSTGQVNLTVPQNFTHLQLRCFVRSDRAAVSDNIYFRLNGDTGSNYTFHYFDGNGSTSSSSGATGQTVMLGAVTSANAPAGIYATNIVDILDYTSTVKNKVIRNLSGYETNSAGQIAQWSGMWIGSAGLAAVTQINIYSNIGLFIAGTRFDLYGISNSPATGA